MASNDNALSCTNSDATFFELLAQCIGTDSSGKKTLRLHSSASVNDSSALGCGKPVDENEVNNLLRDCFCRDTNNDLALRVSVL